MSGSVRSSRVALGVLGIVIAVLIGLVVALVLSAGVKRADAQTLTIGRATVGPAIPSGFVGVSVEFKALEALVGQNPEAIDPAFVHLLQNLAPDRAPVLRIGGDSSDWTWWPVPHVRRPPGVKYDLTPTWMRVARATAQDLHGKLILGVNLEANRPRLAAAEAQAMVGRIGRPYIDALEIGNEPELYSAFPWYKAADGVGVLGRPSGWNAAAFNTDFGRFASVMPDVPLAGPSAGGLNWLTPNLGPFLTAEPRVKLVTIHAYPLKHCSPSELLTVGQLLSNSSSYGLAQEVAPFVATAHRQGKQLRIDEMNAVSCGGFRGVSDTFASSLWVLDALFELARTGVDGINIHTVPGTINEVLGASFAHGTWSVRVHPEYYGMLMFAQAAPAGSHLLKLATATPPGLRVWATRTADGAVRVLLVNNRLRAGLRIRLSVAALSGPATIEQLRAPSIGARTNITLGGQTFGGATTTGLLAGAPTLRTLAATNGTYTVAVPAASAALLTLSPASAR